MKKVLALLLSLTLCLGLLSACGGGSEKPTEAKPAADSGAAAAPAEVKDVALKVWGPQEDQADANSFLPVMCEKFNQAHP